MYVISNYRQYYVPYDIDEFVPFFFTHTVLFIYTVTRIIHPNNHAVYLLSFTSAYAL